MKAIILLTIILSISCLAIPVLSPKQTPSPATPEPLSPEDQYLAALTTTDGELHQLINFYEEIKEYNTKGIQIFEVIEDKGILYKELLAECKAPVNRLTPFIFNITSVPPVEQGFTGEGLIPCQHHYQNSSAAYVNVLAHFRYLENLGEDMRRAVIKIDETCQYNGGSDNFKAHMELSLDIIRKKAEVELYYIRQQKEQMFYHLQSFAQCRGLK